MVMFGLPIAFVFVGFFEMMARKTGWGLPNSAANVPLKDGALSRAR
jgi:hypothetical protein